MNVFGFFYRCSADLGRLLNRGELFLVSGDIKDQLSLALADLVTLVAGIATSFYKAVRRLTSGSLNIDIYSEFPGPIASFRGRCERISELMWRYQLLREGYDGDKGIVESRLHVGLCI
jgi:hypothetical protein